MQTTDLDRVRFGTFEHASHLEPIISVSCLQQQVTTVDLPHFFAMETKIQRVVAVPI